VIRDVINADAFVACKPHRDNIASRRQNHLIATGVPRNASGDGDQVRVVHFGVFLSLAPLAAGAAPISPQRMRGPVKAAASAAPGGAKAFTGRGVVALER
jgi:hypothetical protein